MPGSDFERRIKQILDAHFRRNGINAVVERVPQLRFRKQVIDIKIDSGVKRWYAAVECKGLLLKQGDPPVLYFSRHFTPGQIESISAYLKVSGRRGFLGLEVLRQGSHRTGRSSSPRASPSARRYYVLTWKYLERAWRRGDKRLHVEKDPFKRLKKLDVDEWNIDEAFS